MAGISSNRCRADAMSATLDERLTELEVRLSFVDDTLASLNATVSKHDRALVDIRIAIERLRSELTGVRTALAHDARDEPPPPHY
jgi:SlyX protein